MSTSKYQGLARPELSCGSEIHTKRVRWRKRAWHATGPVRDQFDAEVQPRLDILLGNKLDLRVTLAYRLYMIGSRQETARPTIVFISRDRDLRYDAADLCRRDRLFVERFPYFEFDSCKETFEA